MMTTAMRSPSERVPRPLLNLVLAALVVGLLAPYPTHALSLDGRGEMRLGLRAYTAARVATETMGGEDNPLSFPHSPAGHLRQHRYFLEVKLDHDIKRLVTKGWGLARLFGWTNPDELSYSLQYRGEGEGLYDYGPDEFSHQFGAIRAVRVDVPDLPPLSNPQPPKKFAAERIRRIRRNARQRNRFFLGYLDFSKGPVFVRVGRQILAWGETDQFRLLDNINPLDQSFGGFFIALDERRVPLDMLRASYHFGTVGPLSDTFLEMFGAYGNRVSTNPGIPPGSPWEPGGLSFPNPALKQTLRANAITDFRGGGRLVFTSHDVTYSVAHYYTYLDIPGVRFRIPGPQKGLIFPNFNNPIIAEQLNPRVQITGGSLTFPVPSFYTIVRSELAYIRDEPMNRQGRGNDADTAAAPGTPGYRRLVRQNNIEGGLDPFLYPGFLDLNRKTPIQGRMLQRDTLNFVLGLDINRYFRWLNPTQSFFFSTQFFYKHVFDSPGDLALPVVFRNLPVSSSVPLAGQLCGTSPDFRPCRLRPRLVHLNDNQFLQTLLINTSYYGGRVVPAFLLAYDWQGPVLLQPGVTLVRDPFRVVFDYTTISGPPSGQIGTLRDRDNVRFQVEYVF
jgi:hypothetical protein